MCVKEFLGFICGHCSVPILKLCPIAAQHMIYPPCEWPAHRAIFVQEYCHPCSRVVWNQSVLQQEEEHRGRHQRKECFCEVIFDDIERKERGEQTGLEASNDKRSWNESKQRRENNQAIQEVPPNQRACCTPDFVTQAWSYSDIPTTKGDQNSEQSIHKFQQEANRYFAAWLRTAADPVQYSPMLSAKAAMGNLIGTTMTSSSSPLKIITEERLELDTSTISLYTETKLDENAATAQEDFTESGNNKYIARSRSI
ncbi:hypothetical protein F5884DRAFT_159341 [Xylogone sp. PMI_703]|nr:hypothetical protein F5884DRAFT_159341 [Xylogone sp. PMI_703]